MRISLRSALSALLTVLSKQVTLKAPKKDNTYSLFCEQCRSDEVAHNEPKQLDLACLLSSLSILNYDGFNATF